MNTSKTLHQFNPEQWKYTKSDLFKNFDFDFNPKNENLQYNCDKNEIILYNGKLLEYGNNIRNNKSREDINQNLKEGQGVETKQIKRLGFTAPENVNLGKKNF